MLSIYLIFQINKFFVADPEGPVLQITRKIKVWHKTMKPDNSPPENSDGSSDFKQC